MPDAFSPTDTLCVNAVRTLAMDAVQQANSGHPGAPMGMAPMGHVLFNRVLTYDPADPLWPNRDRFVLSNGHASMFLYALLHLSGVQGDGHRKPVTLDEIKKFRQLDGVTPGHPEHHLTSGVETTTGPLGQGIGNAVGMAIAQKWIAATYTKPGYEDLFAHRVYAICGDGCLMEGIASEACSLAGHLQLDNLTLLYDDNSITIDGRTSLAFTEDVPGRFAAYGWNVLRVADGNDLPAIAAAIEQAKATGVAVEGKVTGVNKGGFDVDLGGGTRAFCPVSQISDRFVEDVNSFVGQSLQFLVTDVRDGGKNVVVSRRALLQREASETMAKAMSDIVPGAVLKGTVSSVRDFGAFIDLGGGVEGMIPRSEISHDRSVAIGDALKPGDAVEVQVREIKDVDPSEQKGKGGGKGRGPTKKITLSLKALAADPWEGLDLAEGRVVLGTVVRSTEFGRFVRLAPGVEGLLHVSELGRDLKADEGEEVRVIVKKMDRSAKKIGLIPAPDDAAVGTTVQKTTVDLKVNAVVTGTVERIETYGIFVQIDGTKGRAGRGLVPNAELGVPRGTDLRKTFPEGSKVTAKVLETGEGKLRLSIKGAQDAEERADFEAAKGKAAVPKSLGTFADLLKGKKL